MKFVIEMNLSSRPAWWLVDDDHRVVAWAGKTFSTMGQADEAAHDFRVNADDPDYWVQPATGGRWRWTAWRPEGARVAASVDLFASEDAASAAARCVQQQACTALGP
jgi:hypothetical protein